MKTNSGFTLIEVLIAMLVLAVGLLGLAGLQATSLKNNQSAYNRSQATQLAYDLADRMRANIAGKARYTAILPSSATAKANCLTTTGCTPADLAENDLFEWNSAVSNNLPSGIGTLAVTGNMFTIRITWDEDRDGDDSNNPNFQTSFQL
jgi:type IV pilus assembly protein PilV